VRGSIAIKGSGANEKRLFANSSVDNVSRHMSKMLEEMDERSVSVRCNRVLTKVTKVHDQ
jgi:hypothetical protein